MNDLSSGKDTTMSTDSYLDLLGKGARDRVTGLSGRVISVSFDLFGCVQCVLKPGIDKDGKVPDGQWLDAQRLEITDHARCMPVPEFERPPKFGATPETHAHGPAEKPAL